MVCNYDHAMSTSVLTCCQVFPNRTEETYPISMTRIVYIEETDFRDHDSKDYYGLAPGKSILLKYAFCMPLLPAITIA